MAQGVGEKTEKATVKKRADARKEGQVLKSTEVNTAFGAIVMFSFMLLTRVSFVNKLTDVFRNFLGPGILVTLASGNVNTPVAEGLLLTVILTMARIILPILGVAVLAGLTSNILQVGFLFSTKPIMPKLNKISPIAGFKRIFSVRTLVELIKSILKVVLLGYIVYSEFSKLLDDFGKFMGLNLYGAMLEILRTALTIALKMSLVLAIIALFDYIFQWRKHEKDLMMTKQEVKDEYKLTEGDPLIKSKIRQKQRQMSMMRMMDSVPGADVVITNPTHYAVALKYETGVDNAPVVVAKGQDYMARKIKQVAMENGVEIVENKPLAQALYKICEVDREIPAEFYQAVADILVYVFKRKNPYSFSRR